MQRFWETCSGPTTAYGAHARRRHEGEARSGQRQGGLRIEERRQMAQEEHGGVRESCGQEGSSSERVLYETEPQEGREEGADSRREEARLKRVLDSQEERNLRGAVSLE